MGREIRRVIPHWEHPKSEPSQTWRRGRYVTEERYKPMFDESYTDALNEWQKNHELWEKHEHPDQAEYPEETAKHRHYAEWNGNAPDVEYYRPDWKPEEATWYQVYETVSEGTPVTPPFATKEELIEYLVENGDFWDQRRREDGNSSMECGPWPREQAEAFVNGPGWLRRSS